MLSSWRCFLLEEREILIWDPCWQLFQRGINYTRANSFLVEASLHSTGLSWGWFCCYFGGGLCAISFFLLLLVLHGGFFFFWWWCWLGVLLLLGFFIVVGFFGGAEEVGWLWPDLLAHVPSGSQAGSSSQRCVYLYEPLLSCCTSFWPGPALLIFRPPSFTFLLGLGEWAKVVYSPSVSLSPFCSHAIP